MPNARLVALALGTQVLLVLLAIGCARLTGTQVPWGAPAQGVAAGLAAAALMCAANYVLLTRGPRDWWLVRGVQSVYRDLLVPLFSRLDPLSVVVIGLAAGIGEEWFFRGFLQPFAGLAVASATFGAAHIGGVRMLAFGAWATVMGVLLGALASITGGVIAPMVAHGVYDVMALEYIRRTHGPAAAVEREEE